jgi:hypothetical protein
LRDKANQSGLGGYCEGLYWHLDLDELLRSFPIPVLEFVAIAVNLIIFSSLLGGMYVTVGSDSLTSVGVLKNFSASTPLMQRVHEMILHLPELKNVSSSGEFLHVFGPSNPAADFASRSKFKQLHELCAAIGIVPVEMKIPERAHEFIAELCQYAKNPGLPLHRESVLTDPQDVMTNNSVRLGKAWAADIAENAVDKAPLHRNTRPAAVLQTSARVIRQRLEASEVSGAILHTFAQKSQSDILSSNPQVQGKLSSTAPVEAQSSSLNYASRGQFRIKGKDIQADLTRRSSSSTTVTLLATVHERASPVKPTRPAVYIRGMGNSTDRRPRVQAAITQRSSRLADALLADTSALALRPDDPARLHGLCSELLHAAAHNGAAGTLQINERSWKHWEEYCASFNTPPVREQPSEQLAIDRETVLQAGFLPSLQR